MSRNTCPYCLSEIVLEAEVCKECGKEVRKIFALRKELSEANDKIKTLEKQLGKSYTDIKLSITDPKTDGLEMSLLFLVTATILQILFIAFFQFDFSFLGFKAYTFITVFIIGALIYYLSVKKGGFNIWHIIIFLFLQPYIVFHIINLFKPNLINKDQLGGLINSANLYLVAAVFFSIAIVLIRGSKDYYFVFSFKPLYERVAIPLTKLEKVDKVFLIILSIAASFGTIYKFFFE